MSEKSSFRRLLDMTDKLCREELEEYYIISESRMNNYIDIMEKQADKVKKLEEIILATKKLIYTINEDSDGDFFICKEASDLIDNLENLIK